MEGSNDDTQEDGAVLVLTTKCPPPAQLIGASISHMMIIAIIAISTAIGISIIANLGTSDTFLVY